jgi:hypothetical protein
MAQLRGGRQQLPTAAGGMQRRRRASCGFLFLSRPPAHCLVSPAPALFLPHARSLCAPFSPSRFPLSFFSCQFSRVFPPPRTEASSYGAHHARFGMNQTPKRRFLDTTVVRWTPHESKASRLLWRPAWSALVPKRRQSDALITLISVTCHDQIKFLKTMDSRAII